MSITLLKTMFKMNWILLLIFFGVLTMYMITMISMFDPQQMEALLTMIKLLPEDFARAFGFSDAVANLTEYLASWLYGMLMLGFPMVYCIILGNRLVAKMVDNGSFAYLLSTPNSRVKIILTSAIYALASIAILFVALFGMGVLVTTVMFPGELNINAFFKLNFTTMLVNMVVMMICFFFSCLFNETRLSLAFGSGFPIAFILMKMLGGVSAEAEILKKLSIYGFYDPVKLVRGGDIVRINLIYIAIIITLFISSILVFKNKRIPL